MPEVDFAVYACYLSTMRPIFPVVLLALFTGLFYVLENAGLHHTLFYGMLALFCFKACRPSRQLMRIPLLCSILLYIAYQALSLSWSSAWSGEELGEALRKGILTFAWILLIAGVLMEEASRKTFWEIVVVMATVSAGCALFLDSGAERLNGLGRSENPVQGGSLYGFALVAAFWLYIGSTRSGGIGGVPPTIYLKERRIEWVCCWGILLLALLATGSRGALLAALLGHGILLYYTCRGVRNIRPLHAFVGIAIVGASAVSVDWSALLSRTDSFRLQIWQQAWEAWAQQPLLGLGYRAPFSMVLPYGAMITQPHSIFITALYYGGVMGLAVLLLMQGTALLQAWRQHNGLALALLVYGMVLGLVDYNLLLVNTEIEWLFYWLPIGMVLGEVMRKQRAYTP